MILKFKKGFKGDYNTLPQRKVEGAVQFKEPDNLSTFSLIMNAVALMLFVGLIIPAFVIAGGFMEFINNYPLHIFPVFAAFLLIIPIHEILHASCFRGEVEFYTCLRKGMCFVVGTESMSKARFVFMSLLPNIVFGFIPYILFLIFPSQLWLCVLGAMAVSSGAGDYINVFNALTQMPKGSKCFMSGMHSYWYMDD